MTHSSRQAWLAAALMVTSGAYPSFAAPSLVEERVPAATVPVSVPSADTDLTDLPLGADLASSSRTIRMLLEMQATPERPAEPASAAKEGTRKPKAGVAVTPATVALSARPATAGGDSESIEWLGNLSLAGFGGGPRGSGVGTEVAYGRPGYGTDQPGGRTSSSESTSRTFSLVPREWIEFLRENRNWVLGGSVALLAVLGVGASFTAQRRR